jgi:ABC-2 type transport system permease protein
MSLRAVLSIAGVNARRLGRDRSALFFLVLLPVMLIFVIGVAIGGFGTRIDVGVVGGEGGPLARSLQRELSRSGVVKVHEYRSRRSLESAFRHGTAFAGVVIPPDYDTTLQRGMTSRIDFISDLTRSTTSAIRAAVTAAVDHEAGVVGAARFAGGSFAASLTVAREQAKQAGGITVRTSSADARNAIPNGFGWTAPTNLVLFVFITAMASSGRLVLLRTSGVARRILASPVSASTLLLGELFYSFVLVVAQGLFIVLVGSVVFDVQWGSLGSALTVLVVTAFVATGLGVLVGSLIRTMEQASAIGPPIGIALGMLGGCMWPLAIVGPFMRTIGHITPQAWAVDAYIKLIGAGAGLREILPQLAVLAAFATLLIPLATWRLRRSVLATS